MHGHPTLEKLNDKIRKPDLRLVSHQGKFIVLPQTKAGHEFVAGHYAHEPEFAGGRIIGSAERMVLVNGQAEAFGISVA